MADDADPGSSSPPSLEEFAQRLDAAKAARRRSRGPNVATGAGGSASSGLGMGFRIATELVASLCVGSLLGFGIDWFAGTSPWGFIAGFFIGVAAGLANVRRAMAQMEANAAANAAHADET